MTGRQAISWLAVIAVISTILAVHYGATTLQ